jgi:hypothetical protein
MSCYRVYPSAVKSDDNKRESSWYISTARTRSIFKCPLASQAVDQLIASEPADKVGLQADQAADYKFFLNGRYQRGRQFKEYIGWAIDKRGGPVISVLRMRVFLEHFWNMTVKKRPKLLFP